METGDHQQLPGDSGVCGGTGAGPHSEGAALHLDEGAGHTHRIITTCMHTTYECRKNCEN